MAVVTAAATGVQIFGGVIDSGQQEGSVSGKAEVKSVGTLRFSDPALKADPVTGQVYPDQLPDSYSCLLYTSGFFTLPQEHVLQDHLMPIPERAAGQTIPTTHPPAPSCRH